MISVITLGMEYTRMLICLDMEQSLKIGLVRIQFMEFVQTCPRAGSSWLNLFEDFIEHGQRPEKCLERMEAFSEDMRSKIEVLEEETLEGKQ